MQPVTIFRAPIPQNLEDQRAIEIQLDKNLIERQGRIVKVIGNPAIPPVVKAEFAVFIADSLIDQETNAALRRANKEKLEEEVRLRQAQSGQLDALKAKSEGQQEEVKKAKEEAKKAKEEAAAAQQQVAATQQTLQQKERELQDKIKAEKERKWEAFCSASSRKNGQVAGVAICAGIPVIGWIFLAKAVPDMHSARIEEAKLAAQYYQFDRLQGINDQNARELFINRHANKWLKEHYDWPSLIEGKQTFPNGTTYTGLYVDKSTVINGVLKFPKGEYTGEFVDGKRHGKGKMSCSNGSVYEGQWKNSKLHGPGKESHTDGSTYKGQYENGLRHGQGEARFADACTYKGPFLNGKANGQGTYTYPSGGIYEGPVVNGLPHGQGVIRYLGGDIFRGSVEKGSLHGIGTLVQPSGTIYHGGFANGKSHGKAVVTLQNGEIYDVIYKEGKLKEMEQRK